MSDSESLSARDRAEVLQLDAALHELAGVVPGDGLAERVLAVCATARAPSRPRGAALPATWLWAAALFVGLGVVGTVAWLRHVEQRAVVAPIQEPQPPDPKPPAQMPQEPKPQGPTPGPAPVAKRWLTLICDYSDNRVVALDENDQELFRLDECYGVWDAELLPNGNVLLTEFSVSRVREVTQQGKTVWEYEDLKNPYAAHRLTVGRSAGNTLICDTFNGRILEVQPDGKVFWSYGDHEHEVIRPFDCEQTPEGNFLIADQLGDRVLEINYHGFVLWQVKNLPGIHDVDRLPNGNTLVTLRNENEVRELDRDGKVVWRLQGLTAPSDADRLPNGNTLVAEHTQVREFDQDGKVVWRHATPWAVEANRYPR